MTTPTTKPVKHSGHLGQAIKLAGLFADDLLYVNGVGWHCWDGKRLAQDDDGGARRAVHAMLKRDREIIMQLNLSTEDEEKALKAVARYETSSAINGILTEAAVLQEFSVTADEVDADPYLFNFANGTLDLRTIQIRPHDQADRMTKVSRAVYDPKAVGTTWNTFLVKVMPDQENREYLRRVVGVALLGRVVEHSLTILSGKRGRNGKGTFYLALDFAFGDYSSMAISLLFMEHKSAGPHAPTPGDMALRGLRLIIVSESGRDKAFDEARLKRLTGGDIINTRGLYEKLPVSFQPSHLPLFITNHLPKVSADDEAVWARLRVVPFDVVIPDDEQDGHLPEKLEAEADAILAWAVEGWKDYVALGEHLDEPPGVLAATADYRLNADDVGRFLDDADWISKAPTLQASTSVLDTGYLLWIKQEGGEEIGSSRGR
jgi:putative DNA primase/helicase